MTRSAEECDQLALELLAAAETAETAGQRKDRLNQAAVLATQAELLRERDAVSGSS